MRTNDQHVIVELICRIEQLNEGDLMAWILALMVTDIEPPVIEIDRADVFDHVQSAGSNMFERTREKADIGLAGVQPVIDDHIERRLELPAPPTLIGLSQRLLHDIDSRRRAARAPTSDDQFNGAPSFQAARIRGDGHRDVHRPARIERRKKTPDCRLSRAGMRASIPAGRGRSALLPAR